MTTREINTEAQGEALALQLFAFTTVAVVVLFADGTGISTTEGVLSSVSSIALYTSIIAPPVIVALRRDVRLREILRWGLATFIGLSGLGFAALTLLGMQNNRLGAVAVIICAAVISIKPFLPLVGRRPISAFFHSTQFSQCLSLLGVPLLPLFARGASWAAERGWCSTTIEVVGRNTVAVDGDLGFVAGKLYGLLAALAIFIMVSTFSHLSDVVTANANDELSSAILLVVLLVLFGTVLHLADGRIVSKAEVQP